MPYGTGTSNEDRGIFPNKNKPEFIPPGLAKKPGFMPPGQFKTKKAKDKEVLKGTVERRLKKVAGSNQNTSPGTPQGPIRSAGMPGNPGNSESPSSHTNENIRNAVAHLKSNKGKV